MSGSPSGSYARGSAAHGYFQIYKSMARLTRAAFLQDPKVKTPVFARFSTVAGGAGSVDLPRDVRGFAVKFYTQEGNFDLVGNNIPVFFIQDAIKFPDLVHAVKMESDRGFPQAASAHDTFWDFVSLMPESMHMLMWAMSDRAIPRSLRMIEGFGIHTFLLLDAHGNSTFVKFHWRPLVGAASVLWDEAIKICGADPDFHRRDLWESIDRGEGPQWEWGRPRRSIGCATPLGTSRSSATTRPRRRCSIGPESPPTRAWSTSVAKVACRTSSRRPRRAGSGNREPGLRSPG
jgi:catalase